MKRNLFLVLIISLMFFACSNKEKQSTSKQDLRAKSEVGNIQNTKIIELSKIVKYFPKGVLEVDSQIEIQFIMDMKNRAQVGTILKESPFSFTPKLDGHVKWISNNTVCFYPDEPMKMATEYQVKIDGKMLLAQENVTDFEFFFFTPKQQVRKFEYDFDTVKDAEKPSVQLIVDLSFYQAVEQNKLQQDLEIKLENHPINFTLSAENQDEFRIITDPISKTDKLQSITLKLPKDYTSDENEWTRSITVLRDGKFAVLTSLDMSENENTKRFGVRFSENLNSDMDISGFISIEPEIEYKTTIHDKYLMIEADFIPGKIYTLKIASGFPSETGKRLDKEFIKGIIFSNIKPAVEWVSKGVFLPSSDDNTIQFKSVNLGSINLKVFKIYEKNIGFFIQENTLSTRNYYNDLYRVGEEIYNEKVRINAQRNIWNVNNINISKILEKNPNAAYIVSLSFDKYSLIYPVVNSADELKDKQLYYDEKGYYNNPSNDGYYQENGRLSKLIFLSDVALTLKKTNDQLHVFAVDVENATPVPNYKLDLYNYQDKVLESAETDKDGYAVFDTKNGFSIRGNDKDGVVMIKVNDEQWETSSFDVSGATKGKNGLKTFMYLDRGVHRPGDNVYLSTIIRSSNKIPPKNQPAILKLINPMNQVVWEEKKEIGEFGHCDFCIPTADNAQTGNWKAELHFAGEIAYQWLKIETVKPNRIKVNIDVPKKIVGLPLKLTGQVSSKYLFGAPGADLKVEGEVNLTEKEIKIKGLVDYTFTDPEVNFQTRSRAVVNGNLDKDGVINLDYTFAKEVEEENCLNAMLKVTVSEKGGSQVSEYQHFLILPDSVLPGIQKSKSYYLKKDQEYDFPIIVVNLDGELIPEHRLEITHFVNQRYWWWEYHNRSDKKDFRKLESTIELESENLISANEAINYHLKIEDTGLHYIHVLDKTTGRTCGLKFYVNWWGRGNQQEEEDQDFLNISFDKEKYNTGDKAQIKFESPANGLYLMTIEQDGEILYKEVKKVKEGITSLSLPITEEMVPNCYLTLSLIQPHGQMANDIPIRTYGIRTLNVEDAETRLLFEIDAPEVTKPKENFKVTINNKSNQATSATIAIVDNGLLDLTHFKTPDPWSYYFKKLRLGVATLDNYDEIIGTLLPDVDNEFSIGGGMSDMAKFGGLDDIQKIKRFKAAVIFKHLPVMKANSSNEFEFTMPDYIGSMRIMVVGCSEKGYGAAEKDMLVKTPLLVLPTVPRMIHPGDKFTVPVSVFALEDSIKDVTVSLKTSEHLKLLSHDIDSLTFEKVGDQEVLFELMADDIIGGAKIEILAKSGKDSSTYSVDLPVSPAFPYMTEVTDTVMLKKGKLHLAPTKFGYENTNSAKLVFTKVPDIKLEKRINYLVSYPYGCIEQTTSGCFSQLYLSKLMDISEAKQQKSVYFVNKGIERLLLFMNRSGFSYWPGGVENADWCTAYLGHFIFSAKEIGYHIPSDLEKHWLKTAKRNCRIVKNDNYRYQSYLLFVMAYSGNPDFGAMNLLRENHTTKMDPLSKTLLATAYYISGKEMVAREVLLDENYVIDDYRELSGTYGSRLRDQALIAYCATLMKDYATANKLMKEITDRYQRYHWFSTQEISYTLLALSKYYENTDFSSGDIPITIKVDGEKKKEYLVSDYLLEFDASNYWDKKITIESEADQPLFIYLYESGIPKEDRVVSENKGLKLSRKFYDDEGNAVNIDTLDQGQSVWVRYLVEATTLEHIDEIALSSMFPAGWEIINPRMALEALPGWIRKTGVSAYDYMDIRDDRINWFFDMYGGKKNFFIKINPTFKGEYILPPVTMEAMYSPEYYSRIQSKKVVVK